MGSSAAVFALTPSLLAVVLGVAVLGTVTADTAGAAPPCAADCNADQQVVVDELLRATRILLGLAPAQGCLAFEGDVAELKVAVDAALAGCPQDPTATSTVTETPTPTLTPTITPTPGLSARVCANHTTDAGEECDDGNLIDGDGCDAHCRSETQVDPCAEITPVAGTHLKAVRVASGLAQPLYATAPPRDNERLFIVEQHGRIRILRDGQILPAPFLDLTSRVTYGGERGFLGLAFHPLYPANGEFFVDYTTTRDGALISVVSRFHVSSDADRADPASEEILLEQPQPYVAHNGGQLAFDAAGYLYISFGDGGRSASTQNNAQDRTTWLGKILRIDVDGGHPFAIPMDNPFAGQSGVNNEIWALGFRNPWRFSFDRGNGMLFIGDVGEGTTEEIDVLAADGGGANFGWCCLEGDQPFSRCFHAASTCPASSLLVAPALQYQHIEGCSVTGGFVYRGCTLPDLRGTYFYADYCTGFIRSARWVDGAFQDKHDWTNELAPGGGLSIETIAGFGEDARGELYLCDLGGEVFKIVPAP